VRRGILFAAAMSLAPVASAPADTPSDFFAAFKTLCIEHRGTPADSLKAAADAGWMPAPRRLLEDNNFDLPTFDGGARLKSTRTDIEILFAGGMTLPLNDQRRISAKFCAFAHGPTHDPALEKQVADWAAVAPFDVADDGATLFMFTEQAGVHHPIVASMDATLPQRFGPDGVSVVMIRRGTRDESEFVAYGVLTLVELARGPTPPATPGHGHRADA